MARLSHNRAHCQIADQPARERPARVSLSPAATPSDRRSVRGDAGALQFSYPETGSVWSGDICRNAGTIGKKAVKKKVITTPAVDSALRTLDEDNRRRVRAWFGELANWDGDESVRNHSHRLDSLPGVYVLKTGTDFRIFFSIQGDTVTIIDIARKQAIVASGRLPEAG